MSLLAALVRRPRALSARASRLGALGITSLSKSQIGEVVRDLDAHAEAFRTRPLDAGPHTFVAADALVLQEDLRAAGGERYGLRIVGNLKSQPALNVLAAYEK